MVEWSSLIAFYSVSLKEKQLLNGKWLFLGNTPITPRQPREQPAAVGVPRRSGQSADTQLVNAG
jgi:hypothetical protein